MKTFSWDSGTGLSTTASRDHAPILVVDHEDSFVYNLVQLIAGLGWQAEVVSARSATAQAMLERRPAAVVLSPGPGRPEQAGCMLDLIRLLPPATPLLGVCLGHQALGAALGARITRGIPTHGKTSSIHHLGTGIFAGIPDPFEAGRYHSLVVAQDSVPEDLTISAWTEDGVVMALTHRRLPRFGVQFHPESILTREGPRIVENFLRLVSKTRSADASVVSTRP